MLELFITYYPLPDIKFNWKCLINNNVDPYMDAVNLYICYKLDRWPRDLDTDVKWGNCLFGSAKLIKIADPDKCKYSNYGIGFDSRSEFLLIEAMEKMLLFLELILAHLCMLIIRKKMY